MNSTSTNAGAERLLVSACLLGERVRYDGGDCRRSHPLLARWAREGRLVPICPEVAGGLPVPRRPAEIEGGDAEAVLCGRARVVDIDGADVTAAFVDGAERSLALARRHGVRAALLKEGSPSCAVGAVGDGGFSGRRVPGAGVTAALLRRHGVAVFGEGEIEALAEHLRRPGSGGAA